MHYFITYTLVGRENGIIKKDYLTSNPLKGKKGEKIPSVILKVGKERKNKEALKN